MLSIQYNLTAAGMYYDYTEKYPGTVQVPAANRRNEILTTAGTITEPVREGEPGMSATAAFFEGSVHNNRF